MFGCLRRIGCLVLLAVLAVGGWLTRDLWWERVTGRRSAPRREWSAVDVTLAPAARRRLSGLSRSGGEVFASFTAAEAGAMVLGAAGGRLPGGVDDMQATVEGDALSVRASVDLTALRSVEALGPVAAFLTSRQRLTLTGRPTVVSMGTGAFRVTVVKVGGVEVPAPAIGVLLRQLDRARAREGPASGGSPGSITFPLPPYVGDIRIARGRVILYKSTP